MSRRGGNCRDEKEGSYIHDIDFILDEFLFINLFIADFIPLLNIEQCCYPYPY